jgi:hypothetical protein
LHTYSVRLAKQPRTLTDISSLKRFSGSLYAGVLGQLVWFDAAQRMQPGLLSSWEPLDGGRRWLLTLAPGKVS